MYSQTLMDHFSSSASFAAKLAAKFEHAVAGVLFVANLCPIAATATKSLAAIERLLVFATNSSLGALDVVGLVRFAEVRRTLCVQEIVLVG